MAESTLEKSEHPPITRKEAALQAYAVFRWLWQEVFDDQSRKRVMQLFLLLIAFTAFHTVQPRLIGEIFNGLSRHSLWRIGISFVCFFGTLVAQRYLDYLVNLTREWILGLTLGSLDNKMTMLLFGISSSQHHRLSSVLSASHMNRARERVLNIQSLMLFEALPSFISILLCLIFLWILSPVAGAMVTFVFLINIAWMFFLNRRVLIECGPLEDEFKALARRRNESWRGIDRVKTCGNEESDAAEMRAWFDRIIKVDRKFWFWFLKLSGIRACTGGVFLLVAVLGWGVYLVWTGQWLVGLLYPLYSWTGRIVENLWTIGKLEHQINWNLPSVKAMIDALTTPSEIVDKEGAVELHRNGPIRIEFANVSHGYEDEAGNFRYILRDINFTVEPGERVALIGPSGAGKTTLMQLGLRFMDPSCGSIRIAGHDLRDVVRSSWMRLLGYIPQRPRLFDASIRHNLVYGIAPEDRSKVSDQQLADLMQSLRIDTTQNLSLDFRVGEEGVLLSGGQAQRIMIGAALIKDPRCMLIDEATSALDSTTEQQVKEGIARALQGDVSALTIAHRLSTVQDTCTKFVVLRELSQTPEGESQIEAIAGSFEELHLISPTFRALARDQNIVIG